jgi:hypothetical protein
MIAEIRKDGSAQWALASAPIVVTDGNGHPVHPIHRLMVPLLEDLSQGRKQNAYQRTHARQAPVEAAPTQHVWDTALFAQMGTHTLTVAANIKHGYDGCHSSNPVHQMMQRPQPIVTDAIDCDNLGIHGPSSAFAWALSPPL